MRGRRDSPRRGARRLGKGLLALALLLPSAASAAAAPAGAEEPAVFFIEAITVQAERLSPEIVLSESLLREGREYSEPELRDAVHRINRLPFVLLAEFSLRKGSERGRYELVVQVYEARRWFSQIGLGFAVNDPIGRVRLDQFGDSFVRSFDDDNFDAIIGRRFAVGRRGLLFASYGSEAGLFAVGYQRYNLFDRNILFSLTLGGEDEYDGRSRAVRAQLGIPLGGNHALRILAGWNRFDFSSGSLVQGIEIRETELEVAWAFNSLDDPVLPRQGSLLELGLGGSWSEDRRSFLRLDGSVGREELAADRLGVVASASRYWPVGSRQSVSAGIGGFGGEVPRPGRRWAAEARLGHQLFLLRNLEPGRWRELRWDSELGRSREEFTGSLVDQGFPGGEDRWHLRAGLTYRNGWGLFRVFVEHAERSFR